MADTPDLGSGAFGLGGSSPPSRSIFRSALGPEGARVVAALPLFIFRSAHILWSAKRAIAAIAVFASLASFAACHQELHPPEPPVVKDGAWLDPETEPQALAYLAKETNYTERIARGLLTTRRVLFDELLAATKDDGDGTPIRLGDYEYNSRLEKGATLPKIFRRRASSLPIGNSPDTTLFADLNQLVPVATSLHLLQLDIHPTKDLLALVVGDSIGGRRELWVMTPSRDIIRTYIGKPVGTVRWLGTGNDLVFTALNNLRPDSAWLLSKEQDPIALVSNIRPDEVISLERTAAFEVQVTISGPAQARNLILPAESKILRNAPPISAEITTIEGPGGSHLEIHRDNGKPELVLFERGGKVVHPIKIPQDVFSVTPVIDFPSVRSSFRVYMSGPSRPKTLSEIDPLTGELTSIGQFNSQPFPLVTSVITAASSHGAQIPITLVQRPDVPAGPLVLEVYGAYGDPEWDSFQNYRLPLLKRGVRFGFVHVRGGGYLGEQWHNAGRGTKKPTAIDDFIAALRAVLHAGLAQPRQIIIQGQSAGGLIVATVANTEPTLIGAAVLRAPFVDVLATMRNRDLPFTEREYLEWGNPVDRRASEVIASYSPLQNVRHQIYPVVFATGSRGDHIIDYRQVLTWFSALRSNATDHHLKLFYLKNDGNHLGRATLEDELWDEALIQAFVLDQSNNPKS